jgi:hypothetical protein
MAGSMNVIYGPAYRQRRMVSWIGKLPVLLIDSDEFVWFLG